jgi:hypothetical protein
LVTRGGAIFTFYCIFFLFKSKKNQIALSILSKGPIEVKKAEISKMNHDNNDGNDDVGDEDEDGNDDDDNDYHYYHKEEDDDDNDVSNDDDATSDGDKRETECL